MSGGFVYNYYTLCCKPIPVISWNCPSHKRFGVCRPKDIHGKYRSPVEISCTEKQISVFNDNDKTKPLSITIWPNSCTNSVLVKHTMFFSIKVHERHLPFQNERSHHPPYPEVTNKPAVVRASFIGFQPSVSRREKTHHPRSSRPNHIISDHYISNSTS